MDGLDLLESADVNSTIIPSGLRMQQKSVAVVVLLQFAEEVGAAGSQTRDVLWIVMCPIVAEMLAGKLGPMHGLSGPGEIPGALVSKSKAVGAGNVLNGVAASSSRHTILKSSVLTHGL